VILSVPTLCALLAVVNQLLASWFGTLACVSVLSAVMTWLPVRRAPRVPHRALRATSLSLSSRVAALRDRHCAMSDAASHLTASQRCHTTRHMSTCACTCSLMILVQYCGAPPNASTRLVMPRVWTQYRPVRQQLTRLATGTAKGASVTGDADKVHAVISDLHALRFPSEASPVVDAIALRKWTVTAWLALSVVFAVSFFTISSSVRRLRCSPEDPLLFRAPLYRAPL
jgi:hypothetical protein